MIAIVYPVTLESILAVFYLLIGCGLLSIWEDKFSRFFGFFFLNMSVAAWILASTQIK